MSLSVEVIIAIIALFVASIQPLCTIWKCLLRKNSERGMSMPTGSIRWLTCYFYRDSTDIYHRKQPIPAHFTRPKMAALQWTQYDLLR
jgi:hypothetical protein